MPRAIGRWWLAPVVASLCLVNPYVRGDGNGYYAWLVSPIVDHDLQFENQYRHADPIFQHLMFEADGRPRPEMITPTGHLGDQWAVGPAILWAPWFLAAHLGVHIAHLVAPALPADGYSWPYRYACAIGTVVYGWLALWLACRCADVMGLGAYAGLAAALVWAATPLVVYQYFLPFHVHALAAFVVAWFIWRWLTARPLDRVSLWRQWGALAGLMTVVYQLNAVLLIIVAAESVLAWRRRGLAWTAGALAQFGAAAFVVWIPQLVGKAIVYGTPLTTGYGDRFFFLSPRLWQTAMSTEHGLFSWTPLALVAVIGIVLAAKDRPPVRLLIAGAAVFFFAVASYQNWHGQSSFGNRFFLSLTVLAVLGVAEVAMRIARQPAFVRVAAMGVAVILCLWNVGLAFQWGTGLVPNRGPVDFGDVARNQVTRVPGEAARFLRVYLRSRDAAAKGREQHDLHDQRYTPIR
jgi:hypothetical protein